MNTTKMINKLDIIAGDYKWNYVSLASLREILSADDSQQRIEELERTIQRWQDKIDNKLFLSDGSPIALCACGRIDCENTKKINKYIRLKYDDLDKYARGLMTPNEMQDIIRKALKEAE